MTNIVINLVTLLTMKKHLTLIMAAALMLLSPAICSAAKELGLTFAGQSQQEGWACLEFVKDC